MPEPVVVPTRGQAMGSRYHARVAMIYAIETGLSAEAEPEDIEVKFLEQAAPARSRSGHRELTSLASMTIRWPNSAPEPVRAAAGSP